ncbi:hypothetical protein H6P81_017901 [Aristolochia fimbriata]|uniref:Ribosomal protein S15 n=1 Tax=Aristolochia fimbriata TaxID=158543 RepID=A0AAV7E3S4_ARIFI|nr:hypothetical protein H6P81_017901 [Aristolochia fimbriata]
MDWWEKVVLPVTKVWLLLGSRMGIKSSRHLKLRYEVKTCEYEDVQIMWKLLRKSESEKNHRFKSKKLRRPIWKTLLCAGRTPY